MRGSTGVERSTSYLYLTVRVLMCFLAPSLYFQRQGKKKHSRHYFTVRSSLTKLNIDFPRDISSRHLDKIASVQRTITMYRALRIIFIFLRYQQCRRCIHRLTIHFQEYHHETITFYHILFCIILPSLITSNVYFLAITFRS